MTSVRSTKIIPVNDDVYIEYWRLWWLFEQPHSIMWFKSAHRRQTGSAAGVTYTAGLYYIVCAAASNRYLIILVVLIPVRAQQNVVWSRQRTVDFWQTLQLSLSQVWHWTETCDDIKPLTARLYMINPLFNENYYILLLHINYHNSLSHTYSYAFTSLYCCYTM